MSPDNAKDLLAIQVGEIITRRRLEDLIIGSKQEDSPFWAGPEFRVGNTPQQGINWIGAFPNVKAVLIRTKEGSYQHDGWDGDNEFGYSLKARKGVVNPEEQANSVLINQPHYGYPVMLFTEHDGWRFEGKFRVTSVAADHVNLVRWTETQVEAVPENGDGIVPVFGDEEFLEGGKKYCLHLKTERNSKIVALLKSSGSAVCDLCGHDYESNYGVNCIVAHHKKPVSLLEEKQAVKLSDFVLLCPNCHRAVHAYMRLNPGFDYSKAKTSVADSLGDAQ